MNLLKQLLSLTCWMVFSLTSLYSGDSPAGLRASLLRSFHWELTGLGKTIPLNIYHNGEIPGPEGAEVVVYMKNAAWERIGREADEVILEDLLERDFLVITADFGDDPKAISPNLDSDLHALFQAVYGYGPKPLLEGLELKPRDFRCFFLPAGYQLATDRVYWELDKHAVHGTLEYILESYNADIVPKMPGLQPAKTPSDMVDRYGKPFDFTIKMDIVYPADPVRPIPTVVHSCTQASRNPVATPTSYRPHFAGFTTRGYAFVVMGHCFNPCVQHYFHFQKFELDNQNAVNCYRAAMRYIKGHADVYGIDADHIGVFGHSKGQQAVTLLSNPRNHELEENLRFEGFPYGSPEKQPWPGYSTTIAAGYQSMGGGLWREEYITPDYAPTLVACGENERAVITDDGHPNFVNRLDEMDANYLELIMEGLGHELPHGYDQRLGVDRYWLMHAFFDRYLLKEKRLPPVILLTSPRDRQECVPPDTAISLHFAPVIDQASVVESEGILVFPEHEDTPIPGTWSVSRGGTLFSFKPDQKLEHGETYRIIATTGVRDKAGTPLETAQTTRFTVEDK